MKSDVSCRYATIKDLDTLVGLQSKLALAHADIDKFYSLQANFDKKVRDFFSESIKSKESMVYVAEIGGKIVGYILCVYKEGAPIFKFRKYASILDIYVEQSFRRKGVANRLFLEAKRFAKRVSADFIVLDVDVLNTSAVNFYLKGGLKPLMTRMIMRVE